VKNAEHLDRVGHTIDEDVVGVDDGLARAGNTAGAVEVRMVGQAIGSVLYGIAEAQRGGWPAFCDVVDDVTQILTRLRAPDDRELHLAWWRSMIARISAMTSSCGMPGSLDAIAFSTLARNQASCASASSLVANSDSMGESLVMRGI